MRMTRLKLFTGAAIVSLLSACWGSGAGMMSVSFSAYTDRPVVLTRMMVNGTSMPLIPFVIEGRADVARPQDGSRRSLLRYPRGKSGVMELDMVWIELPAGTAYAARVDVPLNALQKGANAALEFMPVFAPGGLLIIASDPVPKSASDRTTRDVLRHCADRVPELDFDYTKEPRELPGLFEALQTAVAMPAPPCQE